jgi:hypothetical protein
MLDISFIRQNEDIVKMAAERRGVLPQVQKSLTHLFKVDDARKAFTKEQQVGTEYAACIHEWREAMLEIPNIPDISAPSESAEVERVGERKSIPSMSQFYIERDSMRIYTEAGTKLLESVASLRESFFTGKGYSPRIVLKGGADVSHALLLDRPLPGTQLCALGREEVTTSKGVVENERSSVARLISLCEGSHTKSVEVFERVRAELEELCTLMRIPYVLETVGVTTLPHSAVKMYRLSLQTTASVEKPVILAEWYYEHDYAARRYGLVYTDARVIPAKKRYAHTVRVDLNEAHTWLLAVVAGNASNGVCMLPPALQARFPEGVVPM